MDETEFDKQEATGRLAYILGQSIHQAIDDNSDKIRSLFDYIGSPVEFEDFLNDITQEIKQGRITNEMLADEIGPFVISEGNESRQVPFRHAAIFNCMAKKALEKNDERQAWALVNHASYCIGLAEFEAMQAEPYLMTRKQAASAGGKGRLTRFIVVKEELIRLLAAPPLGGWGTEKETARMLEETIAAFLEGKNQKPLRNTYSSILRLLRDAAVREVFHSNKK